MAKISLDLNQFRASGVYTVESDSSERIVLNTQTVRLVIGFSQKGPFNAPVYLTDKAAARRVFGDIDQFLERRGSFFHRSIFTCLEVGPVFALNLLPLYDDIDRGDKAPYQSFSLSSTEANGRKVWKLYSSYYNKERFWFPDQEYLLGNVNTAGSINTGKLLSVVNLGQTPASVIIKKYKMPQFEVTAREWFGTGKVPSYIHEWDFISDYFVQVIAISGNWSNYKSLSVDPIFKEFFDQRGLKKGKLADFLAHPEINNLVLMSPVGCIIPDLIDGRNVNHSLDTVVNQQIATSGIFIAIDKEKLENYDLTANDSDTDTVSAVDMIGHNFPNPDRANPDIVDFLSYKTSIKEVLGFNYFNNTTLDEVSEALDFTLSPTVPNPVPEAWVKESQHLGRNYGYLNNVVAIPMPVTNDPDNNLDYQKYLEYKNLLIPGESLIRLDNTEPYAGEMSGKWGKIEQIYEETNTSTGRTWLKLVFSHPNKRFEKPDDYVEGLPINTMVGTAGAMKFTIDGSTLTATQQLFWLPPNQTTNSPWPAVGEDILVENTETKTYYYFKVRTTVTVNEGAYPSVSGDYHHDDDTITIEVEDSDAMATLIKNSIGFKIYPYCAAQAQFEEGSMVGPNWVVTISPKFVAEPDKAVWTNAGGTASTPNYYVAYKYSKLYDYYTRGALIPGDSLYYASDKFWYLDYQVTKDADGITVLKVYAYDTNIDGQFGYYSSLPAATIEGAYDYGYNLGTASSIERATPSIGTYDIYVYDVADNLYDDVEIIDNSWNAFKTTFQVKPDYAGSIEVGQYIVSMTTDESGTDHYYLTKVLTKVKKYSAIQSSYVFEYTVNQPIKVTEALGLKYCTRYIPIDDFISYYQLFHLDGFKLTDWHLPGGPHKQAQLEKILGVLDEANTNLTKVLVDKDIITYRYIVDTFDGGLNAMTYPKTYLTKLAAKKGKCLAIMNAPSIKEFMTSNDPRFTDEPTRINPKPILNTRYIADGGNLTLGPSYTFSLPDETNGSKYSGYFAPFLVIRENGKNFAIPPAAHVSNLYVRKFIQGTPYAVVAGTKRGVISEPKLVGLEYDFLLGDREYLEPFGINPIIKKKGVGHMIYANQMAYQKTRSAFNNLHVRDLLISIEEAVEELLSNYLFDFNNPATRLEIKTRVESYLNSVKSNDGIYDYVVIMDETNNPPEVIDQNTGIIDVIIEPARAFQKFISRITVAATGGASSGSGFTNV